jgi:hypothetical protein
MDDAKIRTFDHFIEVILCEDVDDPIL